MPLFGKKDSGKKVRTGHKDIDKQIINIEDKYHLRQVLGKWVLNLFLCSTEYLRILLFIHPSHISHLTPAFSFSCIMHAWISYIHYPLLPSISLPSLSLVARLLNVTFSYYSSFDGAKVELRRVFPLENRKISSSSSFVDSFLNLLHKNLLQSNK